MTENRVFNYRPPPINDETTTGYSVTSPLRPLQAFELLQKETEEDWLFKLSRLWNVSAGWSSLVQLHCSPHCFGTWKFMEQTCQDPEKKMRMVVKRLQQQPTTEVGESMVYPFSEGEYRRGVAAFKKNKVAGIDDVLIELQNNIGPKLTSGCLQCSIITLLRTRSQQYGGNQRSLLYWNQGRTLRCPRTLMCNKPHIGIINLHEVMAKGYDNPCTTYKGLNHLRTVYTGSKSRRKKLMWPRLLFHKHMLQYS